MLRHLLSIAGLLLLLASGLQAQEFNPRLRLSAEEIGLDEILLLEITIEGSAGQGLHFDATFELDNLRLRSGPSSTTAMQIVNGSATTSRSLTWQLIATELGQATIGKILVQIGNQEVAIEGRQISVLEQTPGGRRRRSARNDPFASLRSADPFADLLRRRPRRQQRPTTPPKISLHAFANPPRPYVGQQVIYTLYLYTQANISSVQVDELPGFKGFWMHELPQAETEPDRVELQDEVYTRVRLLERAIFPRRAGSFEIEPIMFTLEAQVPERGSFSFFTRSKQIRRQSNVVKIEVQPLPEAPAGFGGAVGQLQLTTTLEPTELEVGEAATLTVELSGQGHLQGIATPTLPEIPGLKLFPPQQKSGERVRRKKVVGRRTWSFVLVPERPGSWQLPAVEIPYFDPRQGSFRVARGDDFELEVRGSRSLAQASGATVDLHPIRSAALPAVATGGLGRMTPWLFGLPWLLGAVLLLLRRQRGGGHGKVRQELRRALDRAASEERPRQAAAAIEQAWRDFLQQRWQIPPGTPSTQWSRRLSEQGAGAKPAQDLVQLADDLHYLRYAPKLSSTDELRRELIERSRRLLRALAG